jgi:hypothetical protein
MVTEEFESIWKETILENERRRIVGVTAEIQTENLLPDTYMSLSELYSPWP